MGTCTHRAKNICVVTRFSSKKHLVWRISYIHILLSALNLLLIITLIYLVIYGRRSCIGVGIRGGEASNCTH